jgi:23S rRNA pseudouridine1911/1915/1917 synthase
MSESRRIEVGEESDRLDRFLANTLSISRTQAARLVAAKVVLVNGAAGRASYRPIQGDIIEVEVPEAEAPRTIEPYDFALNVPYEDDSLLVVDKPAGLVVHPAPGHWQDTLVNALVARGLTLASPTPERRGIVHRLDRDTSGLMVVAKTDRAHEVLASAMERREISRTYASMVWGHIKETVTVEAAIVRHPNDRKRMMVAAGGRSARTHVHPVARFDACDLVRLVLDTGRTHQIRVHLAHIGHPVVGDPMYGGGGARRVGAQQRTQAEAVVRSCNRQALHACQLGFKHPETGEELLFRSEWPGDLRPMAGLVTGDMTLVARPQMLDYLGFFQADG